MTNKTSITDKDLRMLIRESMRSFQPRKQRSYHQISPGMKSMANAAKRRFAKDYPEIPVKIDGRQGWIIVNGVKAVNVSSADSRPMDIEDMVDQMKQAYLGHRKNESLQSRLRILIKEAEMKNLEMEIENVIMGEIYQNQGPVHFDELLAAFKESFPDLSDSESIKVFFTPTVDRMSEEGIIKLEGSSGYFTLGDSVEQSDSYR